MIDAIRDWYALIRDGLDAFGALNPDWLAGAMLISMLLSWTITQRAKRLANLSKRATEWTAFGIGFVFCLAISTQGAVWPIPWLEVAMSLLVGVGAPFAYWILIRVAGDRISWVDKLRRD